MTQGSSTHRIGIAAALLAGLWCSSVFAASTVEVDCEETAMNSSEVLAETLTVAVTEAEVDSNSETEISAPSSSLSEAVNAEDVSLDEVVETEAELPATAIQLPGVSKENMPRYRRQMNRTDI